MAEPQNNPQNQINYNADPELDDQAGSSARPIIQVTDDDKQTLTQQARDLKKFFDDFETEFTQGNHNSFYIVSSQWINKWKKYVSYDEISSNQEPNLNSFGQVNPGSVNEDLIDNDPRFTVINGYPDDKSFTNVLLRDGIQEGRDYQLITEAAWESIAKDYEGFAIKRPCKKLSNGQTQVEVRLQKIQLVPVNNALLRSIDHDRARDFKVFLFQAPSSRSIKDIRSDFIDICNSEIGKRWFEGSNTMYYSYSLVTEDTLRFWKLDPEQSLDEFFKYLKAQCKKSTSYEYRIEFKGNYLLKDLEIPLNEAEIAENDHIFLEVREQGKGWNFIGDGAPSIDKCEFCNKYQELPIQCPCKKVAYCSEECKFKDKRFHQMRCDRAGEEEEEQNKTLIMKEDSRRGLCGLQNLGNTCFMNSGLQCLSNVQALTDYFLSDKYLKEINETNALGTKGKLVRKYGSFLKNLWFATASVQSPWALKSAISEFQSMFSGYQQHDSQELLAFLLDGLHEDLNRVKNKPFTETIESENQPDYEVGLKSWENHLKRNQSIIVDLLHGQFKSKITCPTCNRISITFDPFNSVSLPIPAKLEKEIDFEFVYANNRTKPAKISVSFPTSTHTVAQLREETAKILNINPKSFYFVFSTQHMKELVTDEANTLTNTLRKKKKIRSLFAFEMAQEDIDADPQERYDVDYITSKKILNYFGRVARKKFTHFRTASLRKQYNVRQIYLKMFQQYRMLWDDAFEDEEKREQWLKFSDEEAFKKVYEEVEKKPFKIFLITNSRVLNECFFCGEKRCENCELAFDSPIQLSDLLSKIKDPDFNLQFEVYFDEGAEYLDLERLNAVTDLTKIKAQGDEKTKGIDIYDCFNQFEEPETLGEDNAWYCSKCKEHQKATKKMEIYKAPPILMIHLKRFKSGGSLLSKSKIVAQVDCPLENLDISDFVINPELPMEYPVEKIPPGYKEQEANGEAVNGDAALAPNGNGQQEEAKTETEQNGAQKNNKPLLYDLFAVVNHYGNLGFGHYTAYGKNHVTNKWYCFDDSSVQEEDPENVCSTASYVLFYKRKGFEFNY